MNIFKIFRISGAVAGFILGVGLFVALFLWMQDRQLDWAAHWQNFSIFGFLVVVGLSYLLMASGARKWALLSRAMHGALGDEPSKGFFLRHYLWQNWVGQFVPPSLAIVLGRGFAMRGMGEIKARAGLASGLWDQALEFAVLVGMIPAAVLFLWGGLDIAAFFWLSAGGILLAVAICYQIIFMFQKKLLSCAFRLLGLSIWRLFLTTLRLVVGSMALGLPFDPILIVAAVPLVSMVALLPLTPGNLGLAEWGWVGVMSLAGADPVLVGLYAIAFRCMVLLSQTLLVAIYELKIKRSK